jgi:hypothetical protein
LETDETFTDFLQQEARSRALQQGRVLEVQAILPEGGIRELIPAEYFCAQPSMGMSQRSYSSDVGAHYKIA